MQYDIAVVGGGASGFAAALSAAYTRPGVRVAVLEKGEKTARKLLASGNGRCNITNRFVSPECYYSHSPGQLAAVLQKADAAFVQNFLEKAGLLLSEEEGRIYPYSFSSASVYRVFSSELQRCHVEMRLNSPVQKIQKAASYRLILADGQCLTAKRVILCGGSKAAPALGGCADGLLPARSLGHTYHRPWPALCAFQCANPKQALLKGVRANGKLTLFENGNKIAESSGEIQFTEYGLSGIPAFQLSVPYGLRKNSTESALDYRIEADLFEHYSAAQLTELLTRQMRHGNSTGSLLAGMLNEKMIDFVEQSLSPETSGLNLTQLAVFLKAIPFEVSDVAGFKNCQVAGGGINLDEIDVPSMQSRLSPGAYLAGEMLDAVGLCGGYNLHWAIGTGAMAGQSAAQSLS